MKSIFKWLAILLLIIIGALILYQNHQVLLEKKTFYLISEDVFGISYGSTELPLLIYFLICIIAGALFMCFPVFAQMLRYRRLRREWLEESEGMEVRSETYRSGGEDVVYPVDEDEETL